MVAETHGLFGMIFNDFGANFRVDDATGEQPNEVMIEHVDKTTGEVATLEESRHNLEDGDYVTFREVKGMVELNDCEPRKVKVVGKGRLGFGANKRSLAKAKALIYSKETYIINIDGV